MQESTRANICLWTGVVILVIAAVFMGSFGYIFTAILNNVLVISPDSKVFDTYTSPDVPIYMDIYFFNVTNPVEVQRYGAKPVVQELGPYKYKEKYQKFDYNWSDSTGTVEYRQSTTYFFDAEKSNGSESDLITTLNPVMVVAAALGYENKLFTEVIWPEIEGGTDLFQTCSFSQLTFEGWDLPKFDFDFSFIPRFNMTENIKGSMYDILQIIGIDVPYLKENKFGYYYKVNNTDDGVYKVNTGAKGMDDYLYIQEWEHEPALSYWNTTYCNMINGTDGTQYPPGVDKKDTLHLFSTDICRSMYLDFEMDTVVQDVIDSIRFVPPKEFLESPEHNDANQCYCTDNYLPGGDDECLDDTMMNVAPCFHGAPVVLSTPHFYQGEEKDINNVVGLNPQKELHETYLDLEPTSGVVMEAAKRIQVNLPLKRYGNLPAFKNVPELIFPIFWGSENAQISQDDANDLHKALTLPYIIAYIIGGVILCIGIILILIGELQQYRIRESKKESKNASTALLDNSSKY